uniref:Uncharacterized protein n=1 Tax=Rhizophora mucronata TaxID=61149 RepID=A0A2P2JFK6_RHIMU
MPKGIMVRNLSPTGPFQSETKVLMWILCHFPLGQYLGPNNVFVGIKFIVANIIESQGSAIVVSK